MTWTTQSWPMKAQNKGKNKLKQVIKWIKWHLYWEKKNSVGLRDNWSQFIQIGMVQTCEN